MKIEHFVLVWLYFFHKFLPAATGVHNNQEGTRFLYGFEVLNRQFVSVSMQAQTKYLLGIVNDHMNISIIDFELIETYQSLFRIGRN